MTPVAASNGFPAPAVRNLPRDPASASAARRFARYLLSDLSEEQLEPVLLTVSELVTNALTHGQGAIELRLSRLPERVRIEVVDEGTGAVPAIRAQASSADGGWGLRIVDEVALAWGCYEGTTHVWAELGVGCAGRS
jgi:anti-sigma regulatory factor (Ser/Thr protein kinase)